MSGGSLQDVVAAAGDDSVRLDAAFAQIATALKAIRCQSYVTRSLAFQVMDLTNALASAGKGVLPDDRLYREFSQLSEVAVDEAERVSKVQSMPLNITLDVLTALGRLQEMRARRRVVPFLRGHQAQARTYRRAAEFFAKRMRLGGGALSFDNPALWDIFSPYNVRRHNWPRKGADKKRGLPDKALEWNPRYALNLLQRTGKAFMHAGHLAVAERIFELAASYLTDNGGEGEPAGFDPVFLPRIQALDTLVDLAQIYEKRSSRWQAIDTLMLAWAEIRQRLLENRSIRAHILARLPNVIGTLTHLLQREGQPNTAKYIQDDLDTVLMRGESRDLAHRLRTAESESERARIVSRADLRFAVERQHPETILTILDAEMRSTTGCDVPPWVHDHLPELEQFVGSAVQGRGAREYTAQSQCARLSALMAMARLAEAFEPHWLGRTLLKIAQHLATSHTGSGERSWLHRAFRAAYRSRDSYVVTKALRLLLDHADLTRDERLQAARSLIAYCAEWTQRTRIVSDKLRLQKQLDPILRRAIFSLAEDGSVETHEAVIAAVEMLGSRALTSLRTEIPRDYFESAWEWRRYRRELMKDLRREIAETEEGWAEEDDSVVEIASWIAHFVLKRGAGALRGRPAVNLKRIRVAMESVGSRGAILTYILHPTDESRVLLIVMTCGDDISVEMRETRLPLAFSALTEGVWADIEDWCMPTSARAASTALLEPVVDLLSRAEWMCVVPGSGPQEEEERAGAEPFMPFHALGHWAGGTCRFLAEDVPVFFYAFSLGHLVHQLLGLSMSYADEVVLIGSHDLSLGASWVDHRDRLLNVFSGRRVMSFAEPEQALAALSDGAPPRRMLYVIGHGEPMNAADPFDTAIRLASSRRAERRLSATRFLSRPVADLVVINACDLGRGHQLGGDFIGFPFAVLQTANGACLASVVPCRGGFACWLGEAIAANLENGLGGARAFAAAVQSALGNPGLRDPGNWAPYVYFGDPRAGSPDRAMGIKATS